MAAGSAHLLRLVAWKERHLGGNRTYNRPADNEYGWVWHRKATEMTGTVTGRISRIWEE